MKWNIVLSSVCNSYNKSISISNSQSWPWKFLVYCQYPMSTAHPLHWLCFNLSKTSPEIIQSSENPPREEKRKEKKRTDITTKLWWWTCAPSANEAITAKTKDKMQMNIPIILLWIIISIQFMNYIVVLGMQFIVSMEVEKFGHWVD